MAILYKKEINDSQCFSILADETTDRISSNEQLTLCVRYLDSKNNSCEDSVRFIKVDSLTGVLLSSAIHFFLYIYIFFKMLILNSFTYIVFSFTCINIVT